MWGQHITRGGSVGTVESVRWGGFSCSAVMLFLKNTLIYFHENAICIHYGDVIMSVIASQITSLMVLLNRKFGCRSKKTSKLRFTGLCARNSSVTGEFPTQRASNPENVSIWWRHHVIKESRELIIHFKDIVKRKEDMGKFVVSTAPVHGIIYYVHGFIDKRDDQFWANYQFHVYNSFKKLINLAIYGAAIKHGKMMFSFVWNISSELTWSLPNHIRSRPLKSTSGKMELLSLGRLVGIRNVTYHLLATDCT